MTPFAELGVRPRTLAALDRTSIRVPLPVQLAAIPPLLERRDLVMEAPTGSGKTLAFGIPLVERLASHRGDGPRALVVVPTRELAAQIVSVLGGVDTALRNALIVGGVGFGGQTAALQRGADIVVGCPGRLLDMATRGILRLDRVEYLVLDEADEMLDQGFARDVERIIAMVPQRRHDGTLRQTVLASATMPDWVQVMVTKHLIDPARVRVVSEQVPLLEHGLLRVQRTEKVATLSALLTRQDSRVIVFHRTKHGAKKLARDLGVLGHRAVELQGNLSQNARDRAIGAFRSGHADVLVATNVAARGLDVDGVGLVVNIELPESPLWLTHRVGRTARNGREGTAVTFLADDDMEAWAKLRRLGAPPLRWVDSQALIADGRLVHLDLPAPGERGGMPRSPSVNSDDRRGPVGAPSRRPDSRRRDERWQPRRATPPAAAASSASSWSRSRQAGGPQRPADSRGPAGTSLLGERRAVDRRP